MRGLATLDEAGTALQPDEDFVLGLPVRLVLAQRLRLPTVERDEFDEMVTILGGDYGAGGGIYTFRGGTLADLTAVTTRIPDSDDCALKVNGWPEGVYVVVVDDALSLEPI